MTSPPQPFLAVCVASECRLLSAELCKSAGIASEIVLIFVQPSYNASGAWKPPLTLRLSLLNSKCRSAWCILVLKTMLQSSSDRSLFLPVLQVCRHFRACWRVDSCWHFGPILTQVSMKISCDSILKAV